MRRVKIGDRLMRVRDEGESKKLPLVFIHGAGSSSVVWMDAVRRLQHGRRVLAPDLPGHGQSDRWHTPADVSIPMYRDAIGTLCAHLKLERVILVGHSMGGQVALACAGAWPERVGAVITVGSAAQMPVGPRVLERLEKDYPHFGEWLAKVQWSPSTPRELVERWSGIVCTAEQEITTADFRAVDRFDARPSCAKIKCPALVVGGEDDLLVTPQAVRALSETIASAELCLLSRAGHLPMLEQADALFAKLAPLLSTLP